MTEPRPPHLSAEGIELLRRFGRPLPVARGEALFHVGDPGDTMYIVERGRIDLLFLGGKESKSILPGEPFGELAFFIGGQPRTATAVAAEEGELRVLGQAEFSALFERVPKVFFNLLRDACRYLLQSEQGLIGDLVQRNRELEQALDYLRRTKRELSSDDSASLIDSATGLYNLRFLFRQLKQRPPEPERTAFADCAPPGLILLELEGLKGIEQAYGAIFLDQLLRRAAALIRDGVGQHDLPCAIAPGRFAILLGPCDPSRQHHIALTDHLRQNLRDLLRELPGRNPELEVASGVALWRPEESGESMFHRAGEYLAFAKRQEGERSVVEGVFGV